MRLTNIRVEPEAKGRLRLTGNVTSERPSGLPADVWFSLPESAIHNDSDCSGDAFVPALLPLAMALNERLEIDGPVSPRMLAHLPTLQDVLQRWNPELTVVPVSSAHTQVRREQMTRGGVSLFFSMGVDSFYSLLKNDVESTESDADPVSHLVLVQGFDVRIDGQEDFFARIEENAQLAAHRFHKSLIVIKTNLRSLSDSLVPWESIYHGAALASVGLSLSSCFSQVLIAASQTAETLTPWGSHPLVDPLWSTESLQVIHDGCEASRLEKLRWIVRNPHAMEHLRVCYKNPNDVYNCGKCPKCLRTMLGLYALGALDACPTLPNQIEPSPEITAQSPAQRQMLEEIESILRRRSDEVATLDLCDRLRKAAEAFESRESARGEWSQWQRSIANAVLPLAGAQGLSILIDEDQIRPALPNGLGLVPFMEHNGQYWGPPADSDAAIAELERLRALGATRLIVTSNANWWLDYYEPFANYLTHNYCRLLRTEQLEVFDLTQPPSPPHSGIAENNSADERSNSADERLLGDNLGIQS